jgi:HK97 family phage portal protein
VFGWIRNTLARKSDASWPIDVIRLLTQGNATRSGRSVTVDSALQVSTVLACATAIAEDLAQCPWKVKRRGPNGGAEDASDHPVYPLLHSAPNEWQTAFEFRTQRAFHLVLTGNAYAFVNRVAGNIVELLPFEPGMVTGRRKSGTQWDWEYVVCWPDGSRSVIPRESMWHTRGRAWSMHEGMSPIRLARESIGLALAAESHSAQLFGNGARPSGVLSTDAKLTTLQLDEIRKAWETIYGGDNSGKTAVLMGGMKFEPITFDASASGMNETRKMQVEEICRGLGVFPARIGYSDKASTFASAEQFFLAHGKFTLAARAVSLNQSADLALLSKEDRADGLFTRHNLNGLMQGASKDRAEFYASGITNGWLTRNDVRRLEDENPLPGLDTPLMPLNMTDGSKPPTNKPDAPTSSDPASNLSTAPKAATPDITVNVDARQKTVAKIGKMRKDPATGEVHFEITENASNV